MDIAATHPNFDAVKELLCILPPYPHMALIDEVADDMGFASERSITALARKAQSEGHDIRIKHAGRSPVRRISVFMPDGGTSFRQAIEYWQAVYGEVDA